MTIALVKKFFSRTIKPAAVMIALSLAMVVGPVGLTSASAQSIQCGSREDIVKVLDKRFKENRFAMGLASNVSLLELFVSKRGTWTILTTRADGKTCIVASGKSWVSMPVKIDGDAV